MEVKDKLVSVEDLGAVIDALPSGGSGSSVVIKYLETIDVGYEETVFNKAVSDATQEVFNKIDSDNCGIVFIKAVAENQAGEFIQQFPVVTGSSASWTYTNVNLYFSLQSNYGSNNTVNAGSKNSPSAYDDKVKWKRFSFIYIGEDIF